MFRLGTKPYMAYLVMKHRTVRWQALSWSGLEHAELREDDHEITVSSVVVGAYGGVRHGTHYVLRLAQDWTFQSLWLERTDGAAIQLFKSNDVWSTPTGVLHGLAGCEDVDLSGSPLTNTLPVRRMKWSIGQSRRLRMAYVPFDSLVPFPDVQIYTRLEPNAFLYQSEDGSFEQVITVDEDGLVVTYPTLFRMV